MTGALDPTEHTQARVLELIATGADLEKVLASLAEWLGGQLKGMRSTVLLLDGDVLTQVAAHGAPALLVEGDPAVLVTDPSSPCAVASSTGQPVLVGDLLLDERWAAWHDVARRTSVRSCWSYPVLASSTGQPLGSFAIYGDEPGLPDDRVDALMLRATHLVGIAVERRDMVQRLEHEATHDPLTGLPNRKRLLEDLESVMARGEDDVDPFVMFLDLDRLKVVNDSLGHEVGDELLVRTAERLRRAIPPEHLVARFGGDEFVVLARDLRSQAEADALARTILDAVAEPVELAGRSIVPAASVGVVRATAQQSPSDVMRDADIAMYRAKSRGGGQHAHFGPAMRRRAFDRLDVEGQLRRALDDGQLRLRFQPVVDLADLSTVGFEALVRWQHPERGLLAPRHFIDVAEETGLIVPLGEWVLAATAEAVRSWRAQAAVPDLWLSVNVSAAQLGSRSLAGAVRATSAQMGTWSLGLELTESTLMVPSRAARAVLDELAGLGVGLSIDDFGTGYSSLSYLTRLPFSTLKIDQSFIADLETNEQAQTVAEAVVRLGDGLRLRVIAEGVETEVQRALLRDMGCTHGQGYLLGRPVPADEVLASLLLLRPPT